MSIRYWLRYFFIISFYVFVNVVQLYCNSGSYLDTTNNENMETVPCEQDYIQYEDKADHSSYNKQSIPSEPEYQWTFSSDCFPGWDVLNEGLQLGCFTGVVNNNEFEVVIVRINPYYYDFSLHMASQNGRAFSLYDWSRRHNLDVAINASMYLTDGFTSTGYLRNADHINNRRIASKFGAFFVADPHNPNLPSANILDRDIDNWEEIIPQYRIVIQNFRLISADRKLLWRSKNIAHSIAAVARDGEGCLLFIHTRYPMSDSNFGELLLSLPIDIRVVMYVEGGSQAGLFLRSPAFTRLWIGKHPVDILDIDHTSSLLPNIIGVRRKK